MGDGRTMLGTDPLMARVDGSHKKNQGTPVVRPHPSLRGVIPDACQQHDFSPWLSSPFKSGGVIRQYGGQGNTENG